jgi:hypothetical protein
MTCLETLEVRLAEVVKLHADVYETLTFVRKRLAEQPLEDLADITCVLNQMDKLGDDIRKECKFLSEAAQKSACLLWAVLGSCKPIQGRLCTASTDVKQMASLPNKSKDPVNYIKLLEYLGLPPERIEDGTLVPHWPSIVLFFTELMAQGKPLPAGIDVGKAYNLYGLRIRRKT